MGCAGARYDASDAAPVKILGLIDADKGFRRPALTLPSHGENRGSSPLGSANIINDLHFE
jgi:hypothetical protein